MSSKDARIDSILIDTYVDVGYTIDDPPTENSSSGQFYPISIDTVELRGMSILRCLSIHEIMMIQRRTFFLLKDKGEI